MLTWTLSKQCAFHMEVRYLGIIYIDVRQKPRPPLRQEASLLFAKFNIQLLSLKMVSLYLIFLYLNTEM